MRITKYTVHEEQWLGIQLLPLEKSTAIINVRSASSSAISNTTVRSTPAPIAIALVDVAQTDVEGILITRMVETTIT